MSTRSVQSRAGRRPGGTPHRRGGPRPTLLTVAAAGGHHRPADWIGPAIERAETQFVEQVVRDGGIGPWRHRVADRFPVARAAAARCRLSRAETAALVVALADIPVRDSCWLRIEEDRDPRWVGLWRHLAAHAVPPYRAEPLFLLAWTGWRTGDVALARTAVDDVRAEDPAHRAAAMLDQILTAGLDAADLPSLAHRGAAHRDAP